MFEILAHLPARKERQPRGGAQRDAVGEPDRDGRGVLQGCGSFVIF